MEQYRIAAREGHDILGEGPSWSAARNALFWVDIMTPAVRSLDIETGAVCSSAMPERIGWAIERQGRDDLIVGLKSGFAVLSLDPFIRRPIGDPEPERPHNRLNDAKVDMQGRIWTGTKDDRDLESTGALYRLDADLTWSRHEDGYTVTNGPAFDPDGRMLYHTDSGTRTVYAFDLGRTDRSRRSGSSCASRKNGVIQTV